jgi:hypothetical protein
MKTSNIIKGFGESLITIATKLMEDEELCKLLFYSDDPIGQVNVEDKRENILHKHIIVNTEIPTGGDKGSYILLTINNFEINSSNIETMDVEFYVDILSPTDDWIYNSPDLRIFSIMEKVVETFESIDLEGVGKIEFGGSSLAVAANGLSGYTVRFTSYELGT